MECVIDQYVMEITDFSSQYGSDGSLSYVAANLVGSPMIYPDYGDHAATFNLRCYNQWWDICPSGVDSINSPPSRFKPSKSFIDVKFETAVYPVRIDFYETYCPGSIVRVWGSLNGMGWKMLWIGDPQLNLPSVSRIFSPPIIQTKELTNMLRIELNPSDLEYYSSIDAIMLVGCTHTIKKSTPIMDHIVLKGIDNFIKEENEIIAGVQQLLSEDMLNQIIKNAKAAKQIKTREDKHKNYKQPIKQQQVSLDEAQIGGYFILLPNEALIHLLKFLDLSSLCYLSQTCHFLHDVVADPFLYINLNLKNYWWLIKNPTLNWLAERCSKIQELDLSWCGPYTNVDTETFLHYIRSCGHSLTKLRLKNCHFIDSYCLYMIANICFDIKELDVANCSDIDHLGFGELKKLNKLTRLDLSRTKIEHRTLLLVLQYITKLEHLNIHNCLNLDIDEIAITLTRFNKCLISFGAWKTRNLTPRGLKALASLNTLKDLDIGWSLSGIITESLGELLRNCRSLERLYLTALRTLTDNDLGQIASHGKNIIQLDIMGTRNISEDAVTKLLKSCNNLRLLDISFCEQISYSKTQQWLSSFPHVKIKGGLMHRVRIV